MTTRRYIVTELPRHERYPNYPDYPWRVAYRDDNGNLRTLQRHKKRVNAEANANAAEELRRSVAISGLKG